MSKTIEFQIPENYVLDEENSTKTKMVFKKKQLSYEDVMENLYENKQCFYPDEFGEIKDTFLSCGDVITNDNNCTSSRQAEKLMAINKMMNVAKFLNGDSQGNEFAIVYAANSLFVKYNPHAIITFNSEQACHDCVEILGEETIKLALSPNF